MELHSCAGLQMPLGRAVLTAHWLGVADAIEQSRLTRLHVHMGMNRGSGEGCKENSIALEGRGGWLFDACGTANSVTAVAMYSSAILVLCVARSDWKGGSQAGN